MNKSENKESVNELEVNTREETDKVESNIRVSKKRKRNASEQLESLPLKTLEELNNYKSPDWCDLIETIEIRSICVKPEKCHTEIDEWTPSIQFSRNSVPRTMVIHDMKGGYLEDRFVYGTNKPSYAFYKWTNIDIFVYFSHEFITIPPPGWINAAHRNGVKILGTIITESLPGVAICDQLLESETSSNDFVNKIITITKDFKLDGWFLNIENPIKNCNNFLGLLKQLTKCLHQINTILITYDSLLNTGELNWCNELNPKNRMWFDYCDGILINYSWNEQNLETTFKTVKHRLIDVYVGIDVFSRNCVGGMNSCMSASIIRKYGFSLGIFAPGWVYETIDEHPADNFLYRFETRDAAFWKTLQPYLYEHGPVANFVTTFNKGVSKNFYNMNEQHIQLSSHAYVDEWIERVKNENDIIQINATENFCQCIKLETCVDAFNGSSSSYLLTNSFHTNVVINLLTCDLLTNEILITFVVKEYPNVNYDFCLLAKKPNGSPIKMNLCANPDNSSNFLGNESEVFLNVYDNDEIKQNLLSKFINKTIDHDWELKSYKLDFLNYTILKIGINLKNTGQLSLGGIFVTNYMDILRK